MLKKEKTRAVKVQEENLWEVGSTPHFGGSCLLVPATPGLSPAEPRGSPQKPSISVRTQSMVLADDFGPLFKEEFHSWSVHYHSKQRGRKMEHGASERGHQPRV